MLRRSTFLLLMHPQDLHFFFFPETPTRPTLQKLIDQKAMEYENWLNMLIFFRYGVGQNWLNILHHAQSSYIWLVFCEVGADFTMLIKGKDIIKNAAFSPPTLINVLILTISTVTLYCNCEMILLSMPLNYKWQLTCLICRAHNVLVKDVETTSKIKMLFFNSLFHSLHAYSFMWLLHIN